MNVSDLLAASGLWPWFLPSALLLALAVGYFTRRDHRRFYRFAVILWLGVSLLLFSTGGSPPTVLNLILSLVVAAAWFAPVILMAFLVLHFQWRSAVAVVGTLLVGLLCIPVAGLVALLAGCAITGDCI